MMIRGLFGKIFLSFWIAGSVVMIASIAAVVFLRPPQRPSVRAFEDSARAHGVAAITLYEKNGQDAATGYLREVAKTTKIEGCLFDAGANAVAGEHCEEYRNAVRSAGLNADSIPLHARNSTQLLLRLAGENKRHYSFVAQIITGPHAPPSYAWKDLLLRGGISILISGIICYALSRYLTKPILRLSSVAKRMTAGELDARVTGPLTLRRDELGEFVRDFNEMAERSEALIGGQRQLLYDVSHELRSPLARMDVALDLLRTRNGEDNNIKRLAVDLTLLNDMIGTILTVAKLEATAVVHQPIRIVLAELLESIAHDADFEAQEKGARVRIISSDASIVEGDHNLIRSAIENVVRNAVRYTVPHSTVELRLLASSNVVMPTTRISVRDYGPGIPVKDLKNIFAPFYRVSDEGSRNSKGVGLGLSITDRIVKLHGGHVRARNESTGGLCMEIDLPLSLPTSPPQLRSDVERLEPSQTPHQKAMTVCRCSNAADPEEDAGLHGRLR